MIVHMHNQFCIMLVKLKLGW